MRRSLSIFALALAAPTMPAAAIDVFPLSEGILRTYESVSQAGTSSYSTRFDGIAVVGNYSTHVLHFAGGEDDGLQQQWSETPEGDTLLHGWYRTDIQGGGEYSPPILWIDVPLSLNKSWNVTTTMVGWGSVTLHFKVVAVDVVSVPAGRFESFTIEWYTDEPLFAKAGAFGPTGQRASLSPESTPTAESYADRAGMVRYRHGTEVDSLQRIEEIVAVESATWTRVRELYR